MVGRRESASGFQVMTWTGFGISPLLVETLFLWGPSTEDANDSLDSIFVEPSTREQVSTNRDGPDGVREPDWKGGAFQAVNGGEVGLQVSLGTAIKLHKHHAE
jgi:hypothetical protein